MPAGYALATMFVNGVPGDASIVRIDPPPIVLFGSTILPNGDFKFWFTNTPGQTFSVLAATNVAQPLNTWTAVGAASEVLAGQYEYTDPQTLSYPARFYRVLSP